jgi:hypothetical protein
MTGWRGQRATATARQRELPEPTLDSLAAAWFGTG